MEFFQPNYLDDYEPSSLDDEIFLTHVSMELLIQSIENQFDDPEEYRKRDYVKHFFAKYHTHQQYIEDEDEKEILDARYTEFTSFLLKMLERYLNVSIPNFYDLPMDNAHGAEDNQEDILRLTYRFFINGIKKNFITVITNYIEKHRNELATMFERKNDITYNNFKSEIQDTVDLAILSNLSAVVDHALHSIVDDDDFFSLCATNKFNLELESVKRWFENFELTGNFIEDYIAMLTPEFKDSIETKVRNKILSKYPYRKNSEIESMKSDEEEEEKTETETE